MAYDIRDEVRLRRVHKTMQGYGYPLQFSVFLCDLDKVEQYAMKQALCEIINQRVDSVAMIDLGEAGTRGTSCFEFLGPHPDLPQGGARIL